MFVVALIRDYIYRFKQFSPNIKNYLIFNTLYRVSLTVYVLYFPRYLLLLGYTEEHLAKMTALSTMFMAGLGLFAGWLSDRIGRRRSFLFGVTVSKTAFFFRGFVTALPAMYLIYAVNGAFGALFMAATSPFLYENTKKEERMHAFSFQGITTRVAGILGNVFGGYLPGLIRVSAPEYSDLVIYRVVFGLALACTLYAIKKLFDIKEVEKEETSAHEEPGKFKFKLNIPKQNMGFLLKFMGAELWLGFGAAHFLPFITMYMINVYGASEVAVGWISSFALVSVIIGLALAPVLAKNFGLTKSITITRVCALPMLLGLAYAPNLWFLAIALALRNTLQQMSGPINRNFMMANVDSEVRATANGLMRAARSGLRALGMLSAGYIITNLGYTYAFWVAFAAYGISVTLFYAFFVRDESAEERFNAAD